MWQRKLAEWAHAEEKAEGLAETAKDETPDGGEPKRLVLEHARMEFNYSDFSDLAVFLRVSVPECGKIVVEW